MSLIKKSDPEIIKKAAKIIKDGGVICFPTETVYGIGALAENELAVKKLFAAKKRPENKPCQIMFADFSMAEKHVVLSDAAKKLALKFLPGSLTIIVNKKPDSTITPVASSGTNTVGIRIPKHDIALQILKEVGAPVSATSANISGEPPAKTAIEAYTELENRVDLIIDGGAADSGLPSTVIDMTASPKIFRQGGISKEEIEKIIGSF